MELTPERWRPSVNSMCTLGWNAGWGVSTVFGGKLIEGTAGLLGEGTDGYALPMLITIGLYVAAIVVEAVFFRGELQRGRRGLTS